MSYPRNAATPPRIAVGAVVQISDGAVQTSGVSIRVVPQGGSAAAGLGTTTYEDGIVLYAPTQAETNYEAFCVIAYKTGCIPAATTVVTSASATAGYSGVDWSKVTSATSTVNLSGTTIKTATDIETDTQDIQSRLPAALAGGRMDASVGGYQSGLTPLQPTVAGRTLDVSAGGEAGIDWANIGSPATSVAFTNTTIATSQVVATVTNRVSANTDQWGGVTVTGMPMPTYAQPTGFLAATFPATVASPTNITTVGAVSGSVGSVTGNVGGNVSGSVGSISGVTFPSNFGSLAITVGGAVTAGTVSDKTGYTLSASGLSSITAWTVAITGNITGNLSGSVGSVTGAVGSVASGVTVTTNNDKTGYSLTQAFPTNFASLGINASGHISRVVLVDTCTANTDMRGTDNAALASVWTSTIAGRIDAAISSRSSHSAADVWSVATRTLTAFSFSVTVGTNNDKTGYSLATAPLDASGTAAAVWGALLASYTTAGTFGARLVRSTNSNNSVAITGANHVAADIHELQPAVIQASHFDLGAIDANALAADAAAEIASAVRTNLATELARIDATTSSRVSQTSVDTLTTYVDTEVAAIKAKTDNLPANPAATSDIPSATAIADMVLSRSVTNVEASAGEHTLCTLILAGLESSITGTTWTIRRTGGTTHYTKTVTTDSGAAPIVGVT